MNINDQQLDTLKEISNIGAGNASQALSKMTDEKIDVSFPSIEVQEIKKIPDLIGNKSEIHSLIKVDVQVENKGDTNHLGTLMLILDKRSSKILSSHLLGNSEIDFNEQLAASEKSALKETGNILTGATLSAMTEWVDLQLQESVPDLRTDMLGAVMDEILLKMAQEEDEALIFRTEFNFKEELDAYFIFLFSKKGRKIIMDRISV